LTKVFFINRNYKLLNQDDIHCTTNFSSILIGWIEKFLNLCPRAKRI